MIGAILISLVAARQNGPKVSQHGHALESNHAGAGMGLHNNPKVRTIVEGDEDQPETLQYTMEINRINRPHSRHSLWHDVSLKPMHGTHHKGMKEKWFFHFVCEMPKGTSEIMEINKTLPLNPIMQARDKDNNPLFITYKRDEGLPFNYGIIPQTWEHPDLFDKKTSVNGDDNAVDVIQINEQPCEVGEIQRIRTLGAFAVKNHEHTDWKILVENLDDPDKYGHEHVDDMHEAHLQEIVEWFKKYPTGEGHPEGEIIFEGKLHDPDTAGEIIMEDHYHWKEMKNPIIHPPPSMGEHMGGGDPMEALRKRQQQMGGGMPRAAGGGMPGDGMPEEMRARLKGMGMENLARNSMEL
jgi:inorganic pyrophosphatase